jgi:dipeptidyl aminopeptidase/acylaminoacyl peptidase
MAPLQSALIFILLATTSSGRAEDATAARPETADESAVTSRRSLTPAESFVRPPNYSGMVLSPLGRQALGRTLVNGAECLVVLDLQTGKARLIGIPRRAALERYGWAGEKRILFSVGAATRWFDRDAYATRLFAQEVTGDTPVFIGRRNGGLVGDDVLFVEPDGQSLLIALQRTPYEYPGVFRASLSSGGLQEVVAPKDHVYEWYADGAGIVRAGIGTLPGAWFLLYRRTADEPFRRVAQGEEAGRAAPLAGLRLQRDSDLGYVLSDAKTGRYALHRYDFANGALGELVFESATNDVDDFDLTDDERSVLSVSYADDRRRTHWLHPVAELRQLQLDEALRGRINLIVSSSRDRKSLLVWSGAATQPGDFYLYEPDSGVLKRITNPAAGIDAAQLPTTRYVRYPARDSLEIPAYLTLPPGRAPRGLPLVVMPHGGPYGVRDELGYDAGVQFLASRGYAVLQPNFRGSAGYGAPFAYAGRGEWGRRMQDDLDDGVRWLADKGLVDPKRVCIVGASYGGYAALWGATRNPETYRCAASLAGVSDLPRQLRYQVNMMRSDRRRKQWRDQVTGEESFDLKAVSPIAGTAGLRVPVLIAHGDEDPIVPVEQSRLYANALAEAGKPHEFHVYEGVGHGFEDPADHADWLRRLEAFLARHNPAD